MTGCGRSTAAEAFSRFGEARDEGALIDLSAFRCGDLGDGAVAGGGLTVIANAPNPAGQSILNKNFPDGISALGLVLGGLIPTGIAAACFMFFR